MLESIKEARNDLKETKHDALNSTQHPHSIGRRSTHTHTTPTHNTDVRIQRAPGSRHYRHVRAYVTELAIKRNVQRRNTAHFDNAHGKAAILIPTE